MSRIYEIPTGWARLWAWFQRWSMAEECWKRDQAAELENKVRELGGTVSRSWWRGTRVRVRLKPAIAWDGKPLKLKRGGVLFFIGDLGIFRSSLPAYGSMPHGSYMLLLDIGRQVEKE